MRGVCGVPIVRVLLSLIMASLSISSVDVFMFYFCFFFYGCVVKVMALEGAQDIFYCGGRGCCFKRGNQMLHQSRSGYKDVFYICHDT